MSSSPKKQKSESARSRKACWEHLNCFKTLCEAHGLDERDCWLIPKTHCTNYIVNDFLEKLPVCLSCSYFIERGKNHPQGRDVFLTEQLRKFHHKSFQDIYQKEESFVDILNRIPDGLFTTDKDCRITYFNPAAEKITGFSARDAVGMFCKDVFKSTFCNYGCALKQGTNTHNRENVIIDIEGRKIPVLCSTSALRDSNGKITGALEIFKDITEQKRLQEEISRREKKYRRIFENSFDMIYTSRLDGKILDVNQAGVDMLGYSGREELLNLASAELLYKKPADREKFLQQINQHGFVKNFEVAFAKKNGTPLNVLVSSRKYENSETGSIEYEGIIKDITRRKKAEEAIKQRNRELSIINSIAVVMNYSMDLHFILKETLKRILDALAIDQGGIFLIDRETNNINLRAEFKLPKQAKELPPIIEFQDPLLREHIIQKNTVLPPEASFPPFVVQYHPHPDAEEHQLTCFLISSKGKTMGFFGFKLPSGREFSRYELHMLGSLGNFLGSSIENAMLVGTIKQHRSELHRLTERLFENQEEERRRIARELHDEAGQSLTAVKLGLDRLEHKIPEDQHHLTSELKEIRKMLLRTSGEIRRLSYNLHPTLLSDLGLEPALTLYFKEIQTRSGMNIDFKMIGFDARLDKDMETTLYRFSQEAMTNTLKHSGAENFSLKIIKSYPKIIFTAEDDGIGFSPEDEGHDIRSMGLLGMRERASYWDGSMQIQGKKGKGTKVRIELYLPKSDSETAVQ